MIAILLSTYNGEQFLEDQLLSLIHQSFIDWHLYIRDDGSTDSTIPIVESFLKKDKRITLLHDEKKHRGVKDSYLWLMRRVCCEYYMFCDQDDIWLPNKVEISYKTIIQHPNTIPVVGCSDLELVDIGLNTLNNSMWKAYGLKKLVNHKDGLKIASMFPGCTMIFNRKARDLALEETFNFPLHDNMISLTTYKNNGELVPIHQPLIRYRQHGNNVVGLISGRKIWFHKLISLRSLLKNNYMYFSLVKEYLGVTLLEFVALKLRHSLKAI